jgi:uncharacterized protein with PIN domain
MRIENYNLINKHNERIESNEIDAQILNNYYRLNLDESKIKIIEKKTQLFDLLEDVLIKNKNEEYIYVGVDAEWKPTCATARFDEKKLVALVQIATNESIYLIDMIKLYDLLDVEELKSFSKLFFCNKKIVKIGYGFTQDIKVLCDSFNSPMDHHDTFRQTVLDLAYLVNYLYQMNVKLFDDSPNNFKEEKGLSELVRLCFGKPLNKSEQISNWEKRPLRRSQIDYAALDAYCLIQIFDYIKSRLKNLNIEIDLSKCIGKKFKHSTGITIHKSDKTNNDNNSSLVQSLKMKQLVEIKKFEEPTFCINENQIKPNELRVVCDNMLGGLGKELRRCGVDALILENERDHTDVAKICRKENRYALTCGLPYFAIRSQLPEGKCIHVKLGNAKEQCTQVLKLFNVQVTMDDLFSRCRRCNTGSYIIFSKNQIKGMWFNFKDNFGETGSMKKVNDLKRKPISRPVDYNLFQDEDLIEKVDLLDYTLKKYNIKIQLENMFDTTRIFFILFFI